MSTLAAPMSFRMVVTLYGLSLGGLLLCFFASAVTLVADSPPEGSFSWIAAAALLAVAVNLAAIVGMARACRSAAGALENLVGLSRPTHSDLLRRLAESVGLVDRQLSTAEAEAERLSHADPLTGLGNRRWIQLRAMRELQQAEQANAPIGLILLRVDHLQQINATFGFDAGDGALITCADVLKTLLRRGDLAARVSGNEFVVLLPGVTAELAERVARRLLSAIAATPQARLGEASLQVRAAAVQWTREKLFEPMLARAQSEVDAMPVPPAPRATLLAVASSDAPDAERALKLL